MTFKQLFPTFTLAIALLGAYAPAQAARNAFRPTIQALNIMTISPTDKKASTTEKALVRSIYKRTPQLPSIIDIEGNSYVYQTGIAPIVKQAKYIYLMSRGYAKRKKIAGPDKDDHFIRKGGCVIHTRDRIAQNVVHLNKNAVAVTFDYKDEYVNFGQKRDISCLSYTYEAIRKANPTAHIIIVSECLGAKTALELAARNSLEKTTIVLESPFFRGSELFEMMQNYNRFASPWILKWGMRFLKHYDAKQDDLPDRLQNIKPHVHIFACHRNGDPLLNDDYFHTHMNTITDHLSCNNVTCYRFNDTQELHSSTFRFKGSQQAVNAFYKKRGLPYCKALAN